MSLSMDEQDYIIRKRLEVDERPLKKLAKKVLALTRPDAVLPSQQELSTDFETYTHTLHRLTLLIRANTLEIDRLERDALAISQHHEDSLGAVESLKGELSVEVENARDRASYDIVAKDIHATAPSSRKTLTQAIEKLEEDLSALEGEKERYSRTWQLRKAGFEEIMDRLVVLQREISGEKADAELRDAAEDSDDEGAVVGADQDGKTESGSAPVETEQGPTHVLDASKQADDAEKEESAIGEDVMDTS